MLRKDKKPVFIEIAVSPLLEKELENYVKDFGAVFVPDKLIAAVVDKKAKAKIEKLLKEDSRLDGVRDKIEVELAGLS